MITLFSVAKVLLVLIGLNHSIMGEKFIVIPILKLKELPPLLGSLSLMKNITRASWHLITIHWWGMAVVLHVIPKAEFYNDLMLIFAVENLLTSFVILICTKGKHFSWPIFLLISICIWYGK